jgi:DNA modification methylase
LNIEHPAVYPIGLPDFFIRLMTKENDVVVDPFLGSGTTALAALKLGRRFLGVEQNEDYVQLAETRIAALSISPTPVVLLSRRPGVNRRVRMRLNPHQ